MEEGSKLPRQSLRNVAQRAGAQGKHKASPRQPGKIGHRVVWDARGVDDVDDVDDVVLEEVERRGGPRDSRGRGTWLPQACAARGGAP